MSVQKFLKTWLDFSNYLFDFLQSYPSDSDLKKAVKNLAKKQVSPKFMIELEKEMSGFEGEIDAYLEFVQLEWEKLKLKARKKSPLPEQEKRTISQVIKYFWNIVNDEIEIWNNADNLREQDIKNRIWSSPSIYVIVPQTPETWLQNRTVKKLSLIITNDTDLDKNALKKRVLKIQQKIVGDYGLTQINFPILAKQTENLTFFYDGKAGKESNLFQMNEKEYWREQIEILEQMEKSTSLWQTEFNLFKKEIKKPQLAIKNYLPIVAIIERRQAEISFRNALLQNGFYPLNKQLKEMPKYKLFFENDENVEDQKEKQQFRLFLTGGDIPQLTDIIGQEKYLAFDDLKNAKEEILQEEFARTLGPDSPLTKLQKEIYLAVLQKRSELKPEWFWPTDDD